MKRGQITLFVILGIIIVAVIGVGVYFRQSILQQELSAEAAAEEALAPEVQDFKDSVDLCLDSIIIDKIILIGLQGGYINLPENSLYLEEEGLTIPYYYDMGTNRAPKIDKVTLELASAIDADAESCIDKEAFPNLQITPATAKSAVSMEDDGIDVTVNYPIQVVSGEQAFQLSQPYDYSYDTKLKGILGAANSMANSKIRDNGSLDIEYLSDFGYQIDIIPIDNSTEVYSVSDQSSLIDDEPYRWLYANRF